MSKAEKISKHIKKVNRKMPMVFYLTVFMFIICCFTAAILFLTYMWFINLGLIKELNLIWAVVALLIGSIVISTCLVRGLGNRIIFRSLRQIIHASKAVANGDFSQQLEVPKEKEIAEICENFNEMVNKLGNNELLARDFISNVSHQFRTPLSSIHGYVQLLESGSLSDEEKSEYFSIIKEKSISLSELVNDVLELSRLDHQSAVLTKELFSVDEQIRKCVLGMEAKLEDKGINIDLELHSINYYGCRELLNEVWNNLIENAIKFSNDNGNITIKLDGDFDMITVSVKDNGIGMSNETKERMYDRFYRGNEVHNRPGSGLGMAMVKSILTKHGGSITVNSELGCGSEFIVKLPVE